MKLNEQPETKNQNARVAKLVDALSSGGSIRKVVLVRIQSRALIITTTLGKKVAINSFEHPDGQQYTKWLYTSRLQFNTNNGVNKLLLVLYFIHICLRHWRS